MVLDRQHKLHPRPGQLGMQYCWHPFYLLQINEISKNILDTQSDVTSELSTSVSVAAEKQTKVGKIAYFDKNDGLDGFYTNNIGKCSGIRIEQIYVHDWL